MLDPTLVPFSGNHTLFLSGPPGAGKTALTVQRLLYLLEQELPAEQIVVMVPQRTLASPYYEALQRAAAPSQSTGSDEATDDRGSDRAGGDVDIVTVGGLARRTLDLFWPLVAEGAGFAQPDRLPRFLTLETAQYYMDRVVEPFLSRGAFDGVTISRARLVSQIIDNLNKAAAVGFAPDEIAGRLQAAWAGESSMLRIYDQVQAVALAFRRACLAHNLLDWSLQIEVFWHHLLPLPQFRRYLLGGYRHLIVDNTEEDIPVAHDLLQAWLPLCESAWLVHDTNGGYRTFLGADPAGALALGTRCRERIVLSDAHVTSPPVDALGAELAAAFDLVLPDTGGDPRQALERPPDLLRFHPQMLDWVAEQVSILVREERTSPGEIAILAPFLGDALRFSLTERLEKRHNIKVRTHRPSRQLREEPAARCLLTLAKLAHPTWLRPPPPADVAHALQASVADLDPVRARLLTDIVYRVKDGQPALTPFSRIVPDMQERISFLLGGRYGELWDWLQAYILEVETNRVEGLGQDDDLGQAFGLDVFFSRIFGEILSQPGFGFHRNLDAGRVAANLIESVRKFRQSFSPLPLEAEDPEESIPVRFESTSSDEGEGVPGSLADQELDAPATPADLNLEYVDMVERGIVSAQYLASWQVPSEDAVLLVPAYTFLMMNRPVSVQFWLDAGSAAWYERIYQPLTHPYVLRRRSPGEEGQPWTDADEQRVRNEALGRLILGLTRRCRRSVYLAYSELNERGYEQQGPLLKAVQGMLRRHGVGGGSP